LPLARFRALPFSLTRSIGRGPASGTGVSNRSNLDFFVFLEKRLAPFRIAEVLDQGLNIIIVKFRLNQGRYAGGCSSGEQYIGDKTRLLRIRDRKTS
jgi:hypothetical protein